MTKQRKTSVLSFIGLTVFYLLIRFPLFSLHGMKQWPLILYLIGAALTLIPGFLKPEQNRTLPVVACLAYLLGFITAYFTRSDYGEGLNNLWILWTYVFLGASFAAVILDIAVARASHRTPPEQH